MGLPVQYGMPAGYPAVKMEGGMRMPQGMVPTTNGARPSSTLGPALEEPPNKRRCVVVSDKQVCLSPFRCQFVWAYLVVIMMIPEYIIIPMRVICYEILPGSASSS